MRLSVCLLALAALAGGCRSPNLHRYPQRQLDRPLTLPDGVKRVGTGVRAYEAVRRAEPYTARTRIDPYAPTPPEPTWLPLSDVVYYPSWSYALTDRWMLGGRILPRTLTYRALARERQELVVEGSLRPPSTIEDVGFAATARHLYRAHERVGVVSRSRSDIAVSRGRWTAAEHELTTGALIQLPRANALFAWAGLHRDRRVHLLIPTGPVSWENRYRQRETTDFGAPLGVDWMWTIRRWIDVGASYRLERLIYDLQRQRFTLRFDVRW